ncbi:MAG: chromate transporter [Dictyoglomus sp. NZ13-RE01]|nr:MAG: chromate transporter [Dictyoglomus sp. NZ13-RE01]
MSYIDLFWVFLKIGWLTLGGGYVMIPLFMEEFVKKRKWVTQDEFLETLTLAQLFPGPIALNFAVAIGYRLKRLKGALVSATAVILPSFVSILVIAIFFLRFEENKFVQGLFYGLRPAIAGLMVFSIYEILSKYKFTYIKIIIAILFTLVLILFKLNPVYIIILALIGSILWVYTGH